MAPTAGHCQRFHHLLEGDRLVGVGIQGHFPHPSQQLLKAGIARQIGAQHQRVHKHADQAFQFGVGAIGNGRTDDQIFNPAVALQEYLKSGQQGHK